MKKVFKFIGIGLVVLVVLAMVLSNGDETSQAEDTSTSETVAEENAGAEAADEEAADEEAAAEAEQSKEIEIVEATAKEVLDAFDDNEVKGNKLYKDQRIKLTGVVANIQHSDFIEEKYLLSIGTGADFELVDIKIDADLDFEDQLMELNKGDEITVLFDCEGYVGGLYVEGKLVEIVY